MTRLLLLVLLGSVSLVSCREMMTPSVIPPPPGKIIYTKVDLGQDQLNAGSVKLIDPVSLEETNLGDGYLGSKPENGRIAWMKKDNSEWDVVVSDADGANENNTGPLAAGQTLYGDGPVLSPALDRVAFSVNEMVSMSGTDYERWQTYYRVIGSSDQHLSAELFWDDGNGEQMVGHERDILPAFSSNGEGILKFTWVQRGNEPFTPAFWVQMDTVKDFSWGTVSDRTWFWYFDGQENGDGFNAQECGRMQIEWGPGADINKGTAIFSISNKVFFCRYDRYDFDSTGWFGMEWTELGAGAWPDISSDGDMIAFATENGAISVQSPSGNTLHTFTAPDSKYYAYPQWSSDNAKILCTMFDQGFSVNDNRFASTGRLVIIDVESETILEVNEDPAYRGYWVE